MSRVSIYPHGLLRKSFDVAGTYSSTSSHDLKKSSGPHEPVAPIERQGNDGRGVVEALNIGSSIERRRVEMSYDISRRKSATLAALVVPGFASLMANGRDASGPLATNP